jgi:NDP-sugar pyrophosphorylase family protein
MISMVDALSQAYKFLYQTDQLHTVSYLSYPSTLSEYGTVSRGICEVENNHLTKIVEHTKVARKDGKLIHTAEDGHEIIVPENAPANMNLFGFQRSFFDVLGRECQDFFAEFITDSKREFFLPSVVMQIIKENTGTITAISTTSSWFGMTYPEDRLEAKNKIQALIDQGAYL